jgi:hypothetical protein
MRNVRSVTVMSAALVVVDGNVVGVGGLGLFDLRNVVRNDIGFR